MKRLHKRFVRQREHESQDEEDKKDDPAHPGECDERGEDSARTIDMAPCEVAPICGCDGCSYDPEGEEDEETDEFAAEAGDEAALVGSSDDVDDV